MTTTATFMTEFRSSMTFEYKTAMDISPRELMSSITPQHQALSSDRKSPEAIIEIERSSELQHSPASSMGTSLNSSPALPVESASTNSTGLGQEYSMRDANMAYPSSDDSVSMPNDMSGYNGDQDDMPSPLAQLQCALEKNGMIGKKIDIPVYPGCESELLQREQERGMLPLNAIEENIRDGEVYKCHICSYTGNSKEQFNGHMDSHFDHKCPFCDYTSRTEGRLKRHVKDFHSETPPDSWAGTRVPRNDGSGGELSMDDSVSSSGNNKPRTYRCKQCGFVAYKKNDFWEHNKTHIKAEKLLTCPQCAFVTEYKHHLEYHIRNHFGSKPFKCGKCNYSCVNKSMLNSHMKSHSNIYQYRCSNCSYATKYCHSLKLHLRKYEHKPASVLNVDGTPNPYPVIDVYGTRRGPRPKKRKYDARENRNLNASTLACTQQNIHYNSIGPMMASNMPVLYPQFFNGYHGNIFVRPPLNPDGFNDIQPPPPNNSHFRMKSLTLPLKCVLCEFTTDHQEVFNKHMLMHVAKDNQDLIKLYGITSETIMQMQDHQPTPNNYVHDSKQVRENGMFKYEMNDGDAAVVQRQEESPVQLMKSTYMEGNTKAVPPNHGNEVKMPCMIQPESNYQEIQTDDHKLSQNIRIDDQENSPNNNCSVIVSHKTTSEVTFVGKEEDPEWEDNSSKTKENLNNESSPLDLSSTKGNDSRSPINHGMNEDGSSSSNEITLHNTGSSFPDLSPNSQPGQSTTQGQTRSRRKGKAFKLDRYLQVDDQASPLTPDRNLVQEQPMPNKDENIFIEAQIAKRFSPDYETAPLPGKESVRFRNAPNSSIPSPPAMHVAPAADDKALTVTHCRPSQPNGYRPISTPERHSFNLKTFSDHPPDKAEPNKSRCADLIPSVPKSYREDADLPQTKSRWQDVYTCAYCEMAFRDCVMYTMHMGYHGYGDPYTCNMCGHESKDKVEFFLHIARAAHS